MLRPVKEVFTEPYPDLLVGLDSPDDAAVWRLDDERALVLTTDFFTPVVDDPYDYGAIAAANSLSDVYAMGGQPFLALNIAALPPDLPADVAREIVRGGAETARAAGVVVAGGHTIQDPEPKFGMVVLGMLQPGRMLTKGGARPGDQLMLTKPLGFGVTTTALKRQVAAQEDVADAVSWMKRLNREAARLAVECGMRCATDITGYALLGHASEIAAASGVALRFSMSKIPLLPYARKYAGLGAFPGGAADNRLFYRAQVQFAPSISEIDEMLLFDPQTSGALLLAAPPAQVERFCQRAEQTGQPAWVVGEVLSGAGVQVED